MIKSVNNKTIEQPTKKQTPSKQTSWYSRIATPQTTIAFSIVTALALTFLYRKNIFGNTKPTELLKRPTLTPDQIKSLVKKELVSTDPGLLFGFSLAVEINSPEKASKLPETICNEIDSGLAKLCFNTYTGNVSNSTCQDLKEAHVCTNIKASDFTEFTNKITEKAKSVLQFLKDKGMKNSFLQTSCSIGSKFISADLSAHSSSNIVFETIAKNLKNY